jgi:hypothetical protein
MKKFIGIIFITLFINNFLTVNAAQRRVGAQVTRKIINKPVNKMNSTPKHISTIKFKSVQACPQTAKKGIAQTPITSHKRTQFQQFAQKHRKKLLITGIVGTACAGKAISSYTRHKKISKNLKVFYDALDLYDTSKQAQENLDAIILQLEEYGGINQINEYGNVPLSMTVSTAKLKPKERKKILKDLLAHGAKPHLKNLNSITTTLNLIISTTSDISLRHSIAEHYLITLKVLLPYYNQEVLHALIKEIHRITSNVNQQILDQKLIVNNKLREERDALVNEREEKIHSPAFIKLSKKKQEEINAMYTIKIKYVDDIFYLQQKAFRQQEEQIRQQLELFKRIQNIAKKALHKGKLSGTSAYKEE